MSDVLKQMSDAIKEANDFRKRVEAMHKDDPKRVEKLLEDILCFLQMEFYIRPKNG